MARSPYGSPSPTLSPPPQSPYLSDSSVDLDPAYLEPRGIGSAGVGIGNGQHGPGSTRSGIEGSVDGDGIDRESVMMMEGEACDGYGEVEVVKCLWEECGVPFSALQGLIEHIHNDHIGVNKSTYTCEWATCGRRGLQQASRFALISHIRAHTGEKPFTCPLPECDKSFTRSDAMAKHMRLQHNISPPLPGRGGSRKRKRDARDDPEGFSNASSVPPSAPPYASTSLSTSSHHPTHSTGLGLPLGAVDPILGSEWDEDVPPLPPAYPPHTGSPSSSPPPSPLPPHLAAQVDPHTGLIMGRSEMVCRYLIVKAKHKFALEQHEELLEELRVVRNEERRIKMRKEEALDRLIRSTMGAQGEFLITQPEMPASMARLAPPPQDPYAPLPPSHPHSTPHSLQHTQTAPSPAPSIPRAELAVNGNGNGIETHPY